MTTIRRLAPLLAVLAIGGAVIGCSTASHAHHLAQKITCGTQVASWYEKGGKANLRELSGAIKATGLADEAFAKGTNHTAAALQPIIRVTVALKGSIAALGADLPPACVPGARANVSAGLSDFENAAAAQDRFVKAVQAKNPTAAQKAGQAGGAAFKAGGVKFLAAVTALKRYVVG